MSAVKSLLFLLFISLPVIAPADVSTDDLPPGALWYLHADFEEMRNTDAGKDLFNWLDEKVFEEIRDETGIDLNKEAHSITAFSDADIGTVIVVKGPVSEITRQKLLAIAVLQAQLTELEYKGKAFYFVSDGEDDDQHHGSMRSHNPIEDLKDGAYISFAIKDKVIVSGNENQMKAMLTSNGKIAGSNSHKGALFVLTADKAFVQAGLKTGELADDEGWDSNIIRNTEQVTLTIADMNGMLAIEAQLVSTDPKMAQSIGGIANGLLSLQAFSSALDPEIKSLLANTKVDVNDNVLSVSMVIAPEIIISILDH